MSPFRRKKNQTVVIGIHGLSNKPPKNLLSKWWKAAIREGLIEYHDYHQGFKFEMIYWADTLYQEPKSPQVKNPKSERFLDEPYLTKTEIKALKNRKIGVGRKFNRGIKWVKEYLFLNRYGLARFQKLFNYVISKSFRDLDHYYFSTENPVERLTDEPVKKVIRERLARTLIKYRKRKIILIAHSMGSIVALDVLHELQQTNISIKSLITIGCPMGLPMVRKKFLKEHGLRGAENYVCPTPDNIDAWFNFFDEDDQLAVHHDLKEGFVENANGIRPIDQEVFNDFKHFYTHNAHKSFGYLRTPEVSEIIFQSIVTGKSAFRKLLNKLFKKRKNS